MCPYPRHTTSNVSSGGARVIASNRHTGFSVLSNIAGSFSRTSASGRQERRGKHCVPIPPTTCRFVRETPVPSDVGLPGRPPAESRPGDGATPSAQRGTSQLGCRYQNGSAATRPTHRPKMRCLRPTGSARRLLPDTPVDGKAGSDLGGAPAPGLPPAKSGPVAKALCRIPTVVCASVFRLRWEGCRRLYSYAELL